MRTLWLILLVTVLAVPAGTGITLAQTDEDAARAGDAPDDDAILAWLLAEQPVGEVAQVPPMRDLWRLGLTDEQIRRIQHLRGAFRERTSRLRIALQRARLDARELMLEAAPPRPRIEEVSRRIGDAYGALVRARLEYMAELRQNFTAEQWTRLQGMMRLRRPMPRPAPGP